jgi:imidazolonepropionase-like amidohydrolase
MYKYGVLVLYFYSCMVNADQSLYIKNARIIHSTARVSEEPLNVYIIDGRINKITNNSIAVDSETIIINGEGLYLTPGLFDSHVHVSAIPGMGYWGDGLADQYPKIADEYFEQQPRSLLYYGVTQVLDPNPGQAWNRFVGVKQHPDYFRCEVTGTPQTYPMLELPLQVAVERYPYFIIDKPLPQALASQFPPNDHTPEAVVRRMSEDGAICVKVFIENGFGDSAEWPLMDESLFDRVKQAADELGLLLLVHANADDMYQAALKISPDGIIHGPWNWSRSARLVRRDQSGLSDPVKAILNQVNQQSIAVSSTFRTLGGLQDLMSPDTLNNPALKIVTPKLLLDWYQTDESQWFKNILFDGFGGQMTAEQIVDRYQVLLDQNRSAVSYLRQQENKILFGSDTPGSPSYGNQPGLATFQELDLLAQSGFLPTEVFTLATLETSQFLGLGDDYGSVDEGKVANLLLLRDNPLESVSAWNSVETIVLHGEVIARESLSAK